MKLKEKKYCLLGKKGLGDVIILEGCGTKTKVEFGENEINEKKGM